MTSNPNPSPELLPCPFCGHDDPVVYPTGDASKTVRGGCRNPDCVLFDSFPGDYRDKAHFAEWWNTRAVASQTLPAPGEVERIKQYIADLLSVVQPFALAAERADEINAVRDPDGDRVYPWNYVNPTHFADAFAIYSERLDPDDWEALNDAESSADNAADRYTEDSVRAMLRGTIEGDTLRGWCKAHDVNPTHAYEFADGKRNAPVDLLAAMGLARTIVVAHPSPALATVAAANDEGLHSVIRKWRHEFAPNTTGDQHDALFAAIRLLLQGGGK